MVVRTLVLLAGCCFCMSILGGCGLGGCESGTTVLTNAGSGATAPLPKEEAWTAALLSLVNQERAHAGAAPLVRDDRADEAAELHALDLEARGQDGPAGPDGLDLGNRLAESGVAYETHGTLLAEGHGDPVGPYAEWLTSPAELDVMVNPLMTHAGVAVQESATGETWWVFVPFR